MAKHCDKILQLQFSDTTDQNDSEKPKIQHIDAIKEFSKDLKGKKVAIHCMMGISRSPAAALIVLMTLGHDYDTALSYVKYIRVIAEPNQLMLDLFFGKANDDYPCLIKFDESKTQTEACVVVDSSSNDDDDGDSSKSIVLIKEELS